jgi:hypothetical protein
MIAYDKTMTADPRAQLIEVFKDVALATVVQLMVQDPDVTDAVIGRELFKELRKHKSPHVEWITAADAVAWASGWSAELRSSTSIAIGAAIDEDPNADTEALGGFVHHNWSLKFAARHGRTLVPAFAVHLAEHYAAQCRRSGLPPENWAKAYGEAVKAGAWAFPKG